MSFLRPPQRIDQLIHLVRDGLDFPILRRVVVDRKAEVADPVAVAAARGDGGADLALQAVDLRGLGVYERLEGVELAADEDCVEVVAGRGLGGIEWHGGVVI